MMHSKRRMRDRKVKRQTTAERKRGGNSPAARRAAAKAKVSSRPAASRFTKVERNPNGSQFVKPKAPKADKSKLTNPSKKRMKEGVAATGSKVTKVTKTKGGDYKTFAKQSPAAKSFRAAFAEAKRNNKKLVKDGKKPKKTITWNNKRYKIEEA